MRVDTTTICMIADRMKSFEDAKVLTSVVDNLVGENVDAEENINLTKPQLIIPRNILFALIDSYLLGSAKAKHVNINS